METTDFAEVSSRLRLLAHPERLRILDAVRRDAECVCHLEALLGKPQPYVSQQLRLLRDAGIVRAEQQGQNIYYGLCDDTVRNWLDVMLGQAQDEDGVVHHASVRACTCPKCTGSTTQVCAPVALAA